jgi:hypothetical protein
VKDMLEKAPLGEGRLGMTAQQDYFEFENLRNFKTLIEALKPVPQFQPIIEALQESELYSTTQNALTTPTRQGRQIAKLANSLYAGAVSLLEMLRVALPQERSESITIKLPDNDNLREVGQTLLTIEKALAQVVVNPTIQGEVRVEWWEPGSLWIVIWLKTLAAVDLVGRISRSAAVLAQEIARCRAISAQVKALNIRNDALQQIADAQEKLITPARLLLRMTASIERTANTNPRFIEHMRINHRCAHISVS